MGGDGGSIPGRADIVRVKGYEFKRNLGGMGYDPNTMVLKERGALSPQEARGLALTRCRVSQLPLHVPIVLDRSGYPYNKEELLERMLAKSDVLKSLGIKSLKDVVTINDGSEALFAPFANGTLQCQLTGVPCNGSKRFLFNWTCGCIFAEKAQREIGQQRSTQQNCPVCGAPNAKILPMIPDLAPP
ncbi:replication termination factor 2 [Gregarina niphandrodes]|uniref:Replication termination factor 2 n=1 Tax=Gregarina niphandrodes TaxID=110365 RepID=A0A023AY75_GRENI|nr:replication termination factor 2 [Gregarina niphandrodes]EZG43617.1 replication termination factor 2 [Gregarina niphandrodes]|eukprot:XP_011133145.1 replication termination factor 2 [Gregarina niphandrodes]